MNTRINTQTSPPQVTIRITTSINRNHPNISHQQTNLRPRIQPNHISRRQVNYRITSILTTSQVTQVRIVRVTRRISHVHQGRVRIAQRVRTRSITNSITNRTSIRHNTQTTTTYNISLRRNILLSRLTTPQTIRRSTTRQRTRRSTSTDQYTSQPSRIITRNRRTQTVPMSHRTNRNTISLQRNIINRRRDPLTTVRQTTSRVRSTFTAIHRTNRVTRHRPFSHRITMHPSTRHASALTNSLNINQVSHPTPTAKYVTARRPRTNIQVRIRIKQTHRIMNTLSRTRSIVTQTHLHNQRNNHSLKPNIITTNSNLHPDKHSNGRNRHSRDRR